MTDLSDLSSEVSAEIRNGIAEDKREILARDEQRDADLYDLKTDPTAHYVERLTYRCGCVWSVLRECWQIECETHEEES